MPYYTQKGVGKDKGKTCVYKKDDRTKVGCTDGSIKKYLAALHINEETDEPNEWDWVREIGVDIEKFIQELSKQIKKHVPVAELDLDFDMTSKGGEYFGKIWLYDRFYELYKYGETFTARFYELDPNEGQYYQFDSYEDLTQTRLLTILLNDMIVVNKKNLNESESDFEWTDDFHWTIDMLVSILTDCNEIKVANYNLQTDRPYGVMGQPSIYTLSRCEEWWDKFSVLPLDDNGRGHAEWYQNYNDGRIGLIQPYNPNKDIRDIDIKEDLWTITMFPRDIVRHLNAESIELFFLLGEDGKPIYDLIPKRYRERVKINWEDRLFNENLNESEDELGWIRQIEVDLTPGEIYDIKTSNGYYWVPEKFIGKKWDAEYDVEMYKFKDLEGSGSGGKSVPYVKELIQKGHIRPYDPNWSIKDEITFSDNIEDALKGGFVIYFKDGVYLDETLSIQDKLFEMGFSFYTKEPNEYITNKDSSKKIQFFECFNWDTSNPRYRQMPSDQRDIKKILLSAVKEDEFRWKPKPNPRLEDQELFAYVKDHNAIVINGDKYVTNDINESEDPLQWIKDVKPPITYNLTDISVGDRFEAFGDFITILSLTKRKKVVIDNGKLVLSPYYQILFKYRNGENDATNSDIFLKLWNEGDIIKLLNESTEEEIDGDELDWIKQQEPEKEFKKSKKYVVDVSHLRPSPMKHSHDPSPTKQDILRKLEEIGYDVEHIDVDTATYFYIEPTIGGVSWQYNEYGNPIEFYYWVDYNTDLMDDPSYGGEYQTINVDEFMFLIDNNLISESEWLDTTKKGYKTDPTKGIVSPSHKVIKDVCEKEKFCKAQGPITFGQLRYLIENSKRKKFLLSLGEGGYKAIIRLLPWFIPQVAIAGFLGSSIRAFNKIIKPTLEETSNYKTWWGKIILKITKLSEGDLPITDPLSKIFFISDGLLHLMDDKVRLKFSKYISDLVATKSDDEPVPEFFVENELRKYLNDKFLLNPPLELKHINESVGISFESRKWAEIIHDEIINNPKENKRIILDGYDYPEVFNTFPIDYVVVDFYDKMTGYDVEKSGYDKDGNYVVLLYIQPRLLLGGSGFSLQSALNHEMKHAWEDYNRRSKGLPSIDNTKESEVLYNRDFINMLSDNNVRGPIKEILKYYYYLSKLETGAYLENVYDGNKEYERIVREIISKDFETFKDRFDLDVNWHLMNVAYDIPFLKKFKSPIDFIDYSTEELRSRALKIIKKINKMRYVHNKG